MMTNTDADDTSPFATLWMMCSPYPSHFMCDATVPGLQVQRDVELLAVGVCPRSTDQVPLALLVLPVLDPVRDVGRSFIYGYVLLSIT